MNNIFVAIDFETADRFRDSACALATVRVESGEIVHKEHRLIKPPRKYFEFTYLHGIDWEMVAPETGISRIVAITENYFKKMQVLLLRIMPLLIVRFLNACCEKIKYKPTNNSIPMYCQACKEKNGEYIQLNYQMSCRYLDIPLNHHEALSDAMACAKIVIAASEK